MKTETNTDLKPTYKVGDRVTVPYEGATGTIATVFSDGDLSIHFDDGDQGCYYPHEVEAIPDAT